MKIIKTTFFQLSVLSIIFLPAINESGAQEIKSTSSATNKKAVITKKNYTKEQEQRVLKKIEELNKDPNLGYNYLTKEEQKVRLEMMKERYPIGWYEKMFGGFIIEDDCNTQDTIMDYRCNHAKALYKLNQEQIISIFLNFDDSDRFNKYSAEMSSIITVVSYLGTGGIASYISGQGYDPNNITENELTEMIKNKIILKKYKLFKENFMFPIN